MCVIDTKEGKKARGREMEGKNGKKVYVLMCGATGAQMRNV